MAHDPNGSDLVAHQGLWSRTKRRFVEWIAHEMRAMAARQQHPVKAILHPTAQLGPEAAIENYRGGKEHITIGAHTFIRGRLFTYGHGGKIDIGEWSYVGPRSEIWSMDSITIGDRVLIAHDVNIHDGTAHSLDAHQRHEHFRHILEKGHPRTWEGMPGVRSRPVIIEDDVWISFGVTILKGVHIGAGSVIAAGSMVVDDVPPGMLYCCEVTPVVRPLSADCLVGTP